MSYPQVDQSAYMAEDGDMADSMDEFDGEPYPEADDTNLDDYDLLMKVTDTSAAQARKGKDLQGIPWPRLNVTRGDYRRTRLEQYRNYENIPLSGEAVDKEFKAVPKGGLYYEFFYNTRLVKPTILHFQLRNLCLDKHGVSFCARTTYEDNAITNAIEIYDNLSGGLHFMASNNDCGVREYDMERFQLVNHFHFPWPVNHTSISPDRKLLTVVGDDVDGLLVDARCGKMVASVVGHLDYSFASAWHPQGCVFATGNQDKTCRLWDLRNLSRPMTVLKGNMGAVRSIRFSSDGQFLVVAEPADFVHIYSTKADYKKRQEIDIFGEISGVSMSPDDESLYIGVWDRTYASLLQYNRRHTYGYYDSLI